MEVSQGNTSSAKESQMPMKVYAKHIEYSACLQIFPISIASASLSYRLFKQYPDSCIIYTGLIFRLEVQGTPQESVRLRYFQP